MTGLAYREESAVQLISASPSGRGCRGRLATRAVRAVSGQGSWSDEWALRHTQTRCHEWDVGWGWLCQHINLGHERHDHWHIQNIKKGRDMETLYLQGPKPRKVKKKKDEEEEWETLYLQDPRSRPPYDLWQPIRDLRQVTHEITQPAVTRGFGRGNGHITPRFVLVMSEWLLLATGPAAVLRKYFWRIYIDFLCGFEGGRIDTIGKSRRDGRTHREMQQRVRDVQERGSQGSEALRQPEQAITTTRHLRQPRRPSRGRRSKAACRSVSRSRLAGDGVAGQAGVCDSGQWLAYLFTVSLSLRWHCKGDRKREIEEDGKEKRIEKGEISR